MADPSTYRPAVGSIPESPGVYRFRDPSGRVVLAEAHATVDGATVTTTYLLVGVLLFSATLSIGTSGFASGK
mgnify:CR=1 FL=1